MTDASVQAVLDETALRGLVNRYFFGLDRRDAAALASIYTPEGVRRGSRMNSEGVVVMEEDMVPVAQHADSLARGVGRFAFSHHIIGSFEYKIDGDDATGDTYALAFLAVDAASAEVSGRIIVRGLRYLDRFVRRPEGWRISYRNGPIALWQYEVPSVTPHIPPFVLEQ